MRWVVLALGTIRNIKQHSVNLMLFFFFNGEEGGFGVSCLVCVKGNTFLNIFLLTIFAI